MRKNRVLVDHSHTSKLSAGAQVFKPGLAVPSPGLMSHRIQLLLPLPQAALVPLFSAEMPHPQLESSISFLFFKASTLPSGPITHEKSRSFGDLRTLCSKPGPTHPGEQVSPLNPLLPHPENSSLLGLWRGLKKIIAVETRLTQL